MSSISPPAALLDLLTSLFSEHELRSFVAYRLPGGERITSLLPGEAASIVQLADHATRVIISHGFATRALFDALLDVVPGRSFDIERVATLWGILAEVVPVTASSEVAPSPPWTAQSREGTWDAFIAYAPIDRPWVTMLAENLHALAVRLFFDEWEVGAGDVVVARLDRGLRESRNGILVVSPAAMASPWVMEEYAALLSRAVASGLRLVPVLFADADVPPFLATRRWVDLRGKAGEEYLDIVRRLAAALKGQPPGPPVYRGPPRTP